VLNVARSTPEIRYSPGFLLHQELENIEEELDSPQNLTYVLQAIYFRTNIVLIHFHVREKLVEAMKSCPEKPLAKNSARTQALADTLLG
jgi:hypothetical protein